MFAEPRSRERRCEVAATCSAELALTIPRVVDDMEDTVDTLYAGWPERIYVVDRGGRIAYAGGRGPFGFAPEDAEAWLASHIGSAP